MSSTKEARNRLKPKKKRKVYSDKYFAVYARKWRKENPGACSVVSCRRPRISGSLCEFHKIHFYEKQRKYSKERKMRVLTHYGKRGNLQCCWRGCEVRDLDMLSIDHKNNDGAKDRREGYEGCGTGLYRRLEREGYPKGYQTLCHNHQWKKEALRRK